MIGALLHLAHSPPQEVSAIFLIGPERMFDVHACVLPHCFLLCFGEACILCKGFHDFLVSVPST